MTWWTEIRAWQTRVGAPYFERLDQLEHTSCLGFRSVYAYDDATKYQIECEKSTAGLTGVEVYSDQLLLDFDNCDPVDTLLWLYDEGYTHSVWHSGNRSVHVHVAINPMMGSYVPYSQRVWVQRHVPLADTTFYHYAGQFRLPGTRHEKTGRRKVLKHEHYGKRLEIPRTDKPEVTYSVRGNQAGKHSFFAHLLRVKGEGERTVYAWHLAKEAQARGMDLGEALHHILWWNHRHAKPPLHEDAVRRKVLEVYTGHGL